MRVQESELASRVTSYAELQQDNESLRCGLSLNHALFRTIGNKFEGNSFQSFAVGLRLQGQVASCRLSMRFRQNSCHVKIHRLLA